MCAAHRTRAETEPGADAIPAEVVLGVEAEAERSTAGPFDHPSERPSRPRTPVSERVRRSDRRALLATLLIFFVVPVVLITAPALFPPSDAQHAARIEAEIRSLELQRADVLAGRSKLPRPEHDTPEMSKVLDEAERLSEEIVRAALDALDARLARLRRELAALRP